MLLYAITSNFFPVLYHNLCLDKKSAVIFSTPFITGKVIHLEVHFFGEKSRKGPGSAVQTLLFATHMKYVFEQSVIHFFCN